MRELDSRQAFSKERIQHLRAALAKADTFASDKACVYVTGSLGRNEACKYSDLDVFIAGKNEIVQQDGSEKLSEKNRLSHLDEICVQAELIAVSREFNYEKFSGDGRYLDRHSLYEFTKALGTEKDDVANTFTARLLLLLESQPLIEDAVYEDIVREVIKSYWRDYSGHETDFMPAFLANDILRLWRTFCVNYEARAEGDTSAEKKLKNYKLKHSRILTCYSALLFLLETFVQHGAVSPKDAFAMVKMTPIMRLNWLKTTNSKTAEIVDDLLNQYENFLKSTSVEKAILLTRFSVKEDADKLSDDAVNLGSLMFDALEVVGSAPSGKKFYRMLLV